MIVLFLLEYSPFSISHLSIFLNLNSNKTHLIASLLPIHHLSFKACWFVVYIGDGDRVGLVIGYIKNFSPW